MPRKILKRRVVILTSQTIAYAHPVGIRAVREGDGAHIMLDPL